MNKKIRIEILDKKRKTAFNNLLIFAGDGFYLAGGTALALQIGHRESLDFDLFRNKEIGFSIKQKAIKKFGKDSIKTLVDTSDEFTFVLHEGIKITLLNYYWDPSFPLVRVAGNIPLLSIRDIAMAKAYALGRRGNYRDYFDLYVIIKNKHASLKEIIKWCIKKYGDVFSERMFLEQLTYLGDIGIDDKIRPLEERFLPTDKLTSFFRKEIRLL